MREKWLFSALLLGVLNLFCLTTPTMALTDQIVPPPMPSPSVKIYTDGSALTQIDYWVSSSGPSSSIRYKTLDYYITLHNPDGSTTAFSFQPSVTPPPPGQTVIDEFTVSAQDLLNAGFPTSSLLIQNLSSISLSATIAIYNASTGEILTTFGDQNSMSTTIDSVIQQQAGSYGFGSQDILDMESRYADSLLVLVQNNNNPQGTPSTDEQVSGQWSWYDYSGQYFEKTWMTVTQPNPATVKAGQGIAVTVTTYYENNNPAAWNGSRYTTGLNSVTINGPLTDDWQQYKLNLTQTTDNMILTNTDVYYNNYYPQTYSKTFAYTDADGNTTTWTEYFYVGYNVPVVKQTWIIPYARFDENGWTRLQSPPTDIDNRYVFGGLNRWYFGFDIPDGQTFNLRFTSLGGTNGRLGSSVKAQITIQGTPYDDFIVRTVDPQNPFPGGEPDPWKGFENYITNLKTWFREPQIAYQQKLVEWKNMSITQMIYDFFVEHIHEGLKNLNGH